MTGASMFLTKVGSRLDWHLFHYALRVKRERVGARVNPNRVVELVGMGENLAGQLVLH